MPWPATTDVAEMANKRRSDGNRGSRQYLVKLATGGPDTISVARLAALDVTSTPEYAPATWNNLVARDPSGQEVSPWVYVVTVPYSAFGQQAPQEVPQPVDDTVEYSFRLPSTPETVKFSKQTTRYGPGGLDDCPDHNGAINVTPPPDQQILGVEIKNVSPTFSFTWRSANSRLDESYLAAVQDLLWKTNTTAVFGHQIGEVLFCGCTGRVSYGATLSSDITFSFAFSPNDTSIAVGPDITVPAKYGWEYLWGYYEKTEDATAKALVQKPVGAYVEKVYEAATFAPLGTWVGA